MTIMALLGLISFAAWVFSTTAFTIAAADWLDRTPLGFMLGAHFIIAASAVVWYVVVSAVTS